MATNHQLKYRNRSRITEFRDGLTGGDGRTLEGYAAVFNASTRIGGYEGDFIEQIAPGAFKKTLSERGNRISMQYNHGRDPAIGTLPIGVYEEIREDSHGLHVRGRLLDTPAADSVRQAVEAGAVLGMSIAFHVLLETWTDGKGSALTPQQAYRLMMDPGSRGPIRRTIREVRLAEAGPVLNPAYEQTSVSVRDGKRTNRAERLPRSRESARARAAALGIEL